MPTSLAAYDDLAQQDRQTHAWRDLLQVTQDLASELQLDRLLEKIVQIAVRVMEARAGSLLLHNPARGELVFSVVEGGGGAALRNKAIRAYQGLAGACFTSREPVIANDVEHDQRFLKGLDESVGFRTINLLAVPLIAKGKAIGVLEVMNKMEGGFDADDQELLSALAAQSTIAIQNARLYEQVVKERDRLLEAEMAVRQELARDLHDGPTQLISSMVMNIRFLRELLQRAPQRAESELIQLEAVAQKALYQVRTMLFDLYPLVLQKQGLRSALEAYVERLRLLEPFAITLEADTLAARWHLKIETALFSIVQEAVANVKKHSNARNLWIRAVQENGSALIQIRDDGQGFDVAQVEANYERRGSLGLLSMKERAQLAGADLHIESEVGHGTTITLRIPVAP